MISNEISKIETENLDLFFKEMLLIKEIPEINNIELGVLFMC